MRSREPAICLYTTDYSETSQVVHFLGRTTGLVRLLAKGTKRPKSKSGGAIDLLVEGDLLFSISDKNPSALGTLMEFSESVSHTPLRRDSRRLNAALYMLELTHASLADHDPHPDVYDLLSKTLLRLEAPDAPLLAVLAWFQWRLLRHVGLLGGLDACVECGQVVVDLPAGSAVFFSSQAGGLLCEGCHDSQREKVRLRPEALAGLGALAATETGQRVALPDRQAGPVNRLLGYHFAHQMGRAMKMARHALPGEAAWRAEAS
jgi:DNA repair protein RecO (recombination protein O)